VLSVFAAGLVTACAHSSATTATTQATTAPKHPAPKARAAAPDASFTLIAGGDIALNGSGANSSTFAGIERYLHGDLVFGNLEGVLAVDGSPKCAPYGVDSCFTFRAEPSSAKALRAAGFTIMNIANNHAMDYGPEAQSETMNALRGADLDYDGLPGQIEVVSANGVKVAFVGTAPYPWAQSLVDIPGTTALVRKASKEADVVIVYMHAGAEGSSADHVPNGPETFLGERRGNPRAFAHAMIDAGADLVLGSGPHTLRGLEWYHGHLIAYSLGNLAGSNTLATDGSLSLSALLSVKLSGDGQLHSGRIIPVRLIGAGAPVYDSSGASVSFIRTLSVEDFPASQLRIGSDGTLTVVAAKRRARP
jgi:hypothetical protein